VQPGLGSGLDDAFFGCLDLGLSIQGHVDGPVNGSGHEATDCSTAMLAVVSSVAACSGMKLFRVPPPWGTYPADSSVHFVGQNELIVISIFRRLGDRVDTLFKTHPDLHGRQELTFLTLKQQILHSDSTRIRSQNQNSSSNFDEKVSVATCWRLGQ
jgi:hypothetical protein